MNLLYYLNIAFESANLVVANNTKGITKTSLLKYLADGGTVGKGGLGYSSAGGFNKFLKATFPDKNNSNNYVSYLLSLIKHKLCSRCSTVKPFESFHSNISASYGVSDYCINCQCTVRKEYYKDNKEKELTNNAIRANRLHLLQTPKWADKIAIANFYKNCPKGFHVDHIVPLNGKTVCGLHTLDNLQYLLAKDNLSKGNKF